MSTPLTVCLLVIGRHLPRLRFLDVLLGSQPALDAPTRVYQRLLAGDVEEATELAVERAEGGHLAGFYDEVGIPVLRMATSDHGRVATAEHRHRVVSGMEDLLDELLEQHPVPDSGSGAAVVCIGAKWEVDSLAARMLAHGLSLAGHAVVVRPTATVSADYVAALDLSEARVVCLSTFGAAGQTAVRLLCKRLRRRWPDLHIVLASWNMPAEMQSGKADSDAVVSSVAEALMCVSRVLGTQQDAGFLPAPTPAFERERLQALHASGALDPRAQPLFDAVSKRAADIFDVPMAMVSLIEADEQQVRGAFSVLPVGDVDLNVPREFSMCGHVVANGQSLVVSDISRDMRFAGNTVLQSKGLRFYAGTALRDEAGHSIGALCLLDTEPRSLTAREVRLLEAMAQDAMDSLAGAAAQWRQVATAPAEDSGTASAIVGQVVPAA